MTPQQAYEWLAQKLCTDERKALDVIFTALPKQVEAAATKWGCHCDLGPNEQPDYCWIDRGQPDNCCLAVKLIADGKGRDDCAEWRRIEAGPNG